MNCGYNCSEEIQFVTTNWISEGVKICKVYINRNNYNDVFIINDTSGQKFLYATDNYITLRI